MIEIITSYIIGVLLIFFTCWLFRLKIKGVTRLLINTVVGGILLFACAIFNIAVLPINPLNALIAGFLGVFGLVVIYIIVVVL